MSLEGQGCPCRGPAVPRPHGTAAPSSPGGARPAPLCSINKVQEDSGDAVPQALVFIHFPSRPWPKDTLPLVSLI